MSSELFEFMDYLRIMEVSFLSLTISLVLLVLFITSLWQKKKKYQFLPPGPTPWPLLGNPAYVVRGRETKQYPELCKKYGPVFTIWKLTEPMVVLCGYEVVKDALVSHGEQFSGRPLLPVTHVASKGFAFISANDQLWRQLRRTSLTILRNCGMGKKPMQDKMHKEVQHLISAITDKGGKPFNPYPFLAFATSNVISMILFGKRHDYKDRQLMELITNIRLHIGNFQALLNQLCNTFPVLLRIPAIRNHLFKASSYLQSFLKKEIDLHKQTLDSSSPRDFIDHFLLKIKEEAPDADSYLSDTGLLMIITGLLAAGTDTTTFSLKYSLVVMAHFPDIQAKVQQEIDQVTGSLRFAGIKDREHLPYTNAVIHEVQRLMELASVGIGHAVTEDIQFNGFTIPKGTTIIPFFSSVLKDPTQWETPDEFNPRHFLDDNGQFCPKPAFMAFSAGKRVCLGESLARMELFLLFCSLLQHFTFSTAPGTNLQNGKALRDNKLMLITSSELCAFPRTISSK
ncbi:cytochrome P450 2C20 isoform X2 [Bombina bombina]|uniref:cytochrome P450 2C20 isoform X2 n=1 Tax=Bombina bombina TaxID=8345 RepID=UPI00235A7E52|nr:cytochrome P450 2C20 isoform X2 [Bombina bombina]